MPYLLFATEQEADERSREAWVAVLGRNKSPEDVTEFLWSRIVGKNGQTALNILEQPEKLDAAEQAALLPALPEGKGANWEKPAGPSDAGKIEAKP